MLGGGGGGAGPAFGPAPFLLGGGGASKRSAPLFPGPQGEPAHGLHPRFVVAEIWADRAKGGGGVPPPPLRRGVGVPTPPLQPPTLSNTPRGHTLAGASPRAPTQNFGTLAPKKHAPWSLVEAGIHSKHAVHNSILC